MSRKPVTDRSAWRPEELASDRSWSFKLTDEQIGDIERALDGVKSKPFAEITRNDFPLPSMVRLLADLKEEIQKGRGFATLSGVPIDYDYPDIERLYWGIGTHLGPGVTQNLETGLIHYITDGELAPKAGARMLGKPRPSSLHVDLSDVVALLCVKQAPDNPKSLVASSMTVYNEILSQHPDYLVRLEEGYYWNRRGPHETEGPHSEFKVPAWSESGGVVSCRFHAGWVRGGHEQANDPLTLEDAEIFEFIASVSEDNAFAFDLEPGDIGFWNNYTTFHGREGFAETVDESQKRVLLRLWLDFEDIRPFADEGRVRYGPVRHGQVGWTAEEVLSGRNNTPHKRRADGAPVVS